MASIHIDKRTKKPTRSVRFDLNGKQWEIRLGAVTAKQAETARLFVEDLINAKVTGGSLRPTTMEWLAVLPDKIHKRICKTGLIESRRNNNSQRLDCWLNRYITGRKDVKARTRLNYQQAEANMVEFFGKDKPLDAISHGDCEDFAIWLRTEKNLAEGTARRRIKRCKQFFASARKHRLIAENPFDGIKCSNYSEDKFHFITTQQAYSVLEACPDTEWRLIFALARFGGLRVPSEILQLEWSDIYWDKGRFAVRSPKTEHLDGKASRMVPIFPELRPYLYDAFEQAEPKSRYVITRYRDTNQNLRTQLKRIIHRAGLEPWPKLFQNLRSTRETELALTQEYPLHLVCAWIGNSQPIAAKHYLQIRDEDYLKAAGQKCSPNFPPESDGIEQNRGEPKKWRVKKRPEFRDIHVSSGLFNSYNTPKGTRTPVSRMRT